MALSNTTVPFTWTSTTCSTLHRTPVATPPISASRWRRLPDALEADVDGNDKLIIDDQGVLKDLTIGRLGNRLADGVTITANNGVLSAVGGGGGGTPLDIAGLPNLPSFEISDTDVLVTEDVSETNAKKHFTFGELADRLADGVTITADAGTLTSVGGGGNASLSHVLIGSVTLTATPNADATIAVPLTSEPEDGGLIEIEITAGTGGYQPGTLFVSSAFSSDDYNDLTQLAASPGQSETAQAASAMVVGFARPNTNKLPTVGGNLSINRGASTMYIRQSDYMNRYGSTPTISVYMVSVDGGGGGGTADGVVSAGSYNAATLTLNRTVGNPVVVSDLHPFQGTTVLTGSPTATNDKYLIWDTSASRMYFRDSRALQSTTS